MHRILLLGDVCHGAEWAQMQMVLKMISPQQQPSKQDYTNTTDATSTSSMHQGLTDDTSKGKKLITYKI
jgi:hypothetical protein